MSYQANIPIDPVDLPVPRSAGRRLRHYRRDLYWRARLRWLGLPDVPQGRPDPDCPDFAVAAIAISRKYCDWCLSMIDSLRRAGAYQGPVYVVTNRPEMFADVDNVFALAVPYSRVRLISKSCKPLLFEWLRQRYIAYIDADVIVTAPIAAWAERARARLQAVDSPLLTYRAGNPVPDSFHGGLLFADREAALPFFRRWLAMLRSGRYLSDQVALKRVATASTPAYYDDDAFIYLYKLVDDTGESRRRRSADFCACHGSHDPGPSARGPARVHDREPGRRASARTLWPDRVTPHAARPGTVPVGVAVVVTDRGRAMLWVASSQQSSQTT